MVCPECDTAIDDGALSCPACGAALVAPISRAPRARRARAAFVLALVALFLVAFAAVLLRPAGPMPAPPVSSVPTVSVEPTIPVDPDRVAIEEAIEGFYATIDAGAPVAASPSVYREGRGGTEPAKVEASGTTTFTIARAVVGSETADVYGRESRVAIAPGRAEVEFRLRLVDGEWLISSWQVARETTLAPQALALSDVTARDIIGTLLQARQAGDVTTLRMLTTQRFQLAHSSWLDGEDRSALLTSYRVLDAKPRGKRFTVRAAEEWKPTPLVTTYTVVMSGGEILVDGLTWTLVPR